MSRTILATTDDGRDPAYTAARLAAVELAAQQRARLILHDRSAESYFVDPYARGTWTADVESGPDAQGLLDLDDLEPLGRSYLARQVREAQEAGVDTFAWLPQRSGASGVADAVERFGVHLVVLPASLARPSLVDRVRGNTLERFRSALRVEIATVGANGIEQLGAAAAVRA